MSQWEEACKVEMKDNCSNNFYICPNGKGFENLVLFSESQNEYRHHDSPVSIIFLLELIGREYCPFFLT